MLRTPILSLGWINADEHQAVRSDWLAGLIRAPVQTADDDGVAGLPIPGDHFNQAAIIKLQHVNTDAASIGDVFVSRVHWCRERRAAGPPLG